jgi:hypothetical protein
MLRAKIAPGCFGHKPPSMLRASQTEEHPRCFAALAKAACFATLSKAILLYPTNLSDTRIWLELSADKNTIVLGTYTI